MLSRMINRGLPLMWCMSALARFAKQTLGTIGPKRAGKVHCLLSAGLRFACPRTLNSMPVLGEHVLSNPDSRTVAMVDRCAQFSTTTLYLHPLSTRFVSKSSSAQSCQLFGVYVKCQGPVVSCMVKFECNLQVEGR